MHSKYTGWEERQILGEITRLRRNQVIWRKKWLLADIKINALNVQIGNKYDVGTREIESRNIRMHHIKKQR